MEENHQFFQKNLFNLLNQEFSILLQKTLGVKCFRMLFGEKQFLNIYCFIILYDENIGSV